MCVSVCVCVVEIQGQYILVCHKTSVLSLPLHLLVPFRDKTNNLLQMSELKCELGEHLKQKSSEDRYICRRISVNNCKHDLQFLF